MYVRIAVRVSSWMHPVLPAPHSLSLGLPARLPALCPSSVLPSKALHVRSKTAALPHGVACCRRSCPVVRGRLATCRVVRRPWS